MNLIKIFNLKSDGKIIGFTCSTFDLLHAGHCAMLAEAKSKCDYLIVGILVDPSIDRPFKNKPIQTIFERWVQLSSLEYVDLIIPFQSEKDLEDLLLTILPDVRIVGEEYKNINHTGKDIECIKMHYNSRRHSYSSSSLRERILNTKEG